MCRCAPAVAIAVAVALALAPAGASATAIQDQTLRYALFYERIDAGEVTVDIRNQDAGYVVTSTAKPSRLASLFVKAHHSATRFVRHHGEVALAGGDERLLGANGEDGYAWWFRFDRARARVEFSNGDARPIAPGERFEAAAFPLLLMLRPLAGLGGTRVVEVSARRARDYIFEPPVAESVRVPAGEFASWKISRHRSDKPDDRVSVWLRRDGEPLPLKIQVTKRGRTSALLLTAE